MNGWLKVLIDVQAENTRLIAECADLRARLKAAEAAETVSRNMARYILSGVPWECETCTNTMRNMGWDSPNKGCDGGCRHDYGKAETVDEVLAHFGMPSLRVLN